MVFWCYIVTSSIKCYALSFFLYDAYGDESVKSMYLLTQGEYRIMDTFTLYCSLLEKDNNELGFYEKLIIFCREMGKRERNAITLMIFWRLNNWVIFMYLHSTLVHLLWNCFLVREKCHYTNDTLYALRYALWA